LRDFPTVPHGTPSGTIGVSGCKASAESSACGKSFTVGETGPGACGPREPLRSGHVADPADLGHSHPGGFLKAYRRRRHLRRTRHPVSPTWPPRRPCGGAVRHPVAWDTRPRPRTMARARASQLMAGGRTDVFTSSSKGVRVFRVPTSVGHRQYETLRAFFVEKLPSRQAATKFGYTDGSFRVLCHQSGRTPPAVLFARSRRHPTYRAAQGAEKKLSAARTGHRTAQSELLHLRHRPRSRRKSEKLSAPAVWAILRKKGVGKSTPTELAGRIPDRSEKPAFHRLHPLMLDGSIGPAPAVLPCSLKGKARDEPGIQRRLGCSTTRCYGHRRSAPRRRGNAAPVRARCSARGRRSHRPGRPRA
jgi:hypothetical protein